MARLFRYLTAGLGASISEAACASLLGLDPATTHRLLAELADSALIAEVEPGRYSSHVLVRAYAEELFLTTDAAADQRAAGTRLLQHYLHSSFAAHLAVRPHLRSVPPGPAMTGVTPELPESFEAAMSWFARERQVLVAAVQRAPAPPGGIAAGVLGLTRQQVFQRGGFFHDWMAVMETALQAARRDGNRLGQAYSLRSLAGAHYFFGNNAEALNLLEEAEKLFTVLKCHEQRGYVHCNRGDILVRLARYEEALAQYRAAHELFRISGNTQREVRAMSEIGHVMALRGDFEEATAQLDNALERNRVVGNLEQEGQIRLYRARLQIQRRDFPAAVSELEHAVDVLHAVGHRTLEIDGLQLLAECWLEVGQVEKARHSWKAAVSILESFQNGGTVQFSERLGSMRSRLQP